MSEQLDTVKAVADLCEQIARLKTQVVEADMAGFLRGLDFSIQVLKDEANRIREKALLLRGVKV